MTIILSSFRARLEATERDLAIEAIKASHGSVSAAARLCGLHPFQMRRIIERHDLQSYIDKHSARGGNLAWRALGSV
jgi:transcriptional regulator with GAF, ATPase, and Fis domain